MRRFLVYVLALLLLVGGELETHQLYTREDASGEDQLVPASNDNCSDYDVRLVEGNGYMGRVEACYSRDGNSSMWGPICAQYTTSWGGVYAMIVCQQLNFSTAATAVSILYDNVEGPYSYLLYCHKTYNTIQKCERDPLPNNCKVAGGVICYVPEEKKCLTGDVRLVNGSSVAGRVEVCFNGVWGTVCKTTYWNASHATVVCRQLGFEDAHVPIGVRTLRYGEGNSTQPILLYHVECSGHEANLSECIHSDVNVIGQCTHGDDVGVVCEAPAGGCSDTDIRLQGGHDDSSGTIQVCFTGIWGGVCVTEWDEVDALVACRQLGFSELVHTDSVVGSDPLVQNLLSGLNCSGSEERLADCDHDGVNTVTIGCSRATVWCKNKVLHPTSPSLSSLPSSPTSPTSPTKDSNAVIIGSVLGGLVPALIVTISITITVFVCTARYQRRQKRKRYSNKNMSTNYDIQKSISPLYSGHLTTLFAELQLNPIVVNSSCIQLEDVSQYIPREMLIRKENIQLSNIIGQGEFGQVYKGYLKTHHMTDVVAVKTLKALSSATDVKLLIKEIAKMVHFNHPNVMTLTGVVLDDRGAPLLVMPYMAKGTLLTYVRDNKPQFLCEDEEEPDKIKLAAKAFCELSRQIALGMEYLAKNKVVHRDLAARNCLLDISGTVKVADFGLSEDVYSVNYYRQRKCSDDVEAKVPIRWMPLESIEDGLYTEKSDVWSFGVTVWEIFTCGKVPYHGISCMALPDLLLRGERLERPRNKACSQEIYSLLEDCWHVKPQDRPKFAKIVQYINTVMEEHSGYLHLT